MPLAAPEEATGKRCRPGPSSAGKWRPWPPCPARPEAAPGATEGARCRGVGLWAQRLAASFPGSWETPDIDSSPGLGPPGAPASACSLPLTPRVPTLQLCHHPVGTQQPRGGTLGPAPEQESMRPSGVREDPCSRIRAGSCTLGPRCPAGLHLPGTESVRASEQKARGRSAAGARTESKRGPARGRLPRPSTRCPRRAPLGPLQGRLQLPFLGLLAGDAGVEGRGH